MRPETIALAHFRAEQRTFGRKPLEHIKRSEATDRALRAFDLRQNHLFREEYFKT